MFNYEPLKHNTRPVILDTDIGPDCDDAGALDILLKLAVKYNINVLGVANCTSNEYGNGAIRAISEYNGFMNIKIGQNKTVKLLEDGLKYNKYVTQKYMEDLRTACSAEEAYEFYSNLLSNCEDNSVSIITIGMFTNLATVLNKNANLFNQKVNSIISMGGTFNKVANEYNISCDVNSARCVNEKYKGPIIFSGYEVGLTVNTGFESYADGPVFESYYQYLDKTIPCLRSSWDLTAVHYAIEGESYFYKLSTPHDIEITDSGSFINNNNINGNRFHLIKKAEDIEIENYLNDILRSKSI